MGVVVAVELLVSSVSCLQLPSKWEHASVVATLAARRRIFGHCRDRPRPLFEHLQSLPEGGTWQDPCLQQPANLGTFLARELVTKLGLSNGEYKCDRERSMLQRGIARALATKKTKAHLGGFHSSARSRVPCARGLVACLSLELTVPTCRQANIDESCIVRSDE